MQRSTIRGVRCWLQSVAPQRRTLKTDALAGHLGAIGNVPSLVQHVEEPVDRST